MTPPSAAIVLAGGRGSRLGGADKGALVVGGRTLLASVLDAVSDAGVPPERTVVVGPPPPTPPVPGDFPPVAGGLSQVAGDLSPVAGDLSRPGVRLTRENPPFGGPLAALGAGLALLDHDGDGDGDVLLLACDLPHATALVALLTDAVPPGRDGVVVRDSDGRDQWLAARYRLAILREAVAAVADREPDGLTGLPLRAALRDLTLASVADERGASRDVDTPGDLEAAVQESRRRRPTPGRRPTD